MSCPRPSRLAPLLLALLTCDGGAWITVELVIAAGERPFEGVKTVRLTVSGAAMESVSAVAGYRAGAEVELPRIPPGRDRVITVEGIDDEGAVLARGSSAPFEVADASPERVAVPFAACTGTLYRDADGDSRGDRLRARRACPAPGWVAQGDDCNDGNPEVHLGQTRYFAQPATGSAKPFDYDCDGVETPERGGAQVACLWSPPDCVGTGWRGSVPACGASGIFVGCEKKASECVETTGESLPQTCR